MSDSAILSETDQRLVKGAAYLERATAIGYGFNRSTQRMSLVVLKRETPVSLSDYGGFEVYQAPWNSTEAVTR